MSNNRNRRGGKRPANAHGNGHQSGKAEVVRHAARGNADKPFVFQYQGRAYTLPDAGGAAEHMPAAHLIDALMGEDTELGEMRLGIATLQAADVDPDAMAALRAMPLPQFADVVGRWLRRSGVSAPESARSSS
jgi:hypothetical protein